MQSCPNVYKLVFTVFRFFTVVPLLLLVVFTPARALASINQTINFQGKLVDSSGLNVPDGTQYELTFKLYNVASSGTAIWTEVQGNVSVTSGIFQVQLGSVTSLAGIDFNNPNLYLGITVSKNGTGGATGESEMTPRVQFTGVPYAFNAGSLSGVVATQSATGFTLTGGYQNPKTLTLNDNITIGLTITPTSTNALTVKSNGASGLTLDTGGAAALGIGASANAINIGNNTFANNTAVTITTGGSGIVTIGSNTGTGNVVIQPNAGGQAALVVIDQGSGDIFTASASGNTKFVVTNGGNIISVAGAKWEPLTDSFSALQVANAGGTAFVNFDSTNQRVGIGITAPRSALDVVGNLTNLAGTAALTQVSSPPTTASPIWPAVQGKYAYVAASTTTNAIQVFDITNPSLPIAIGTASASVAPNQIAVAGRYLYAAEGGSSCSGACQVQIFDISNSNNPASVKILNLGTGNQPSGLFVSGQYMYIADSGANALDIYNLATPTNPVKVGSVAVGTSPRKVYVQGRYAYTVNVPSAGLGEMRVIDVSDPAGPVVVSNTLSLSNSPFGIAVEGRYAYVPNDSDTDVVDISNPASISKIKTVGANNAYGAVVSGRYLFVTHYNGGSSGQNRIEMFDVGNVPGSPTLLQTVTTNVSNARGLTLAGRYLYVADVANNNLLVYDISGVETTSATIHSLEAGSFQVDTNAYIANNLYVGAGLNVGIGGISANGAITANANGQDGTLLSLSGLAGTTPIASISGNTSYAGVVIDNGGAGDLFTASASGVTQFVITNNGSVGINVDNSAALLGTFDLRAENYAVSTASVSGATGKAALQIDNVGVGDLFTASQSGNTQFVITNGGFVGIGNGVKKPLYRLDVQDSQAATYAASITNLNSGANTRALQIKLGATAPGISNRWIDFTNGNGFIEGHIAGNASNFAALTTGGGDYAEYFKQDNPAENLPVGTLICMGQNGVTACDTTHANILGAVSDNYSVLGNAPDNSGAGEVVVGLVGQIRVKVSAENGFIQPGDAIGVSSVTGVGAKATKAGIILGKALESYASIGTGTIMVAVNAGFTGGSELTDILNGLQISGTDTSGAVLSWLIDHQPAPATNLSQLSTDRLVAGLDVITPHVTTDKLSANKINFTSTDGITDLLAQISTSSATVSVQSLSVLGMATVSADLRVKGNGLFEGVLSVIDTLRTSNLIVGSIADFFDNVVFHKDVTFTGRPTFNSDTAGFAVIHAGATQVDVSYGNAYGNMPVVTATLLTTDTASLSATSQNALQQTILSQGYTYVVTNQTTNGFSIVLNKPATTDVSFSWTAIAVSNPTHAQSTQSASLQIISPTPIPTASITPTP